MAVLMEIKTMTFYIMAHNICFVQIVMEMMQEQMQLLNLENLGGINFSKIQCGYDDLHIFYNEMICSDHFLLLRIKEMGMPSLLNPVVLGVSGDHLCQCHCDLPENKHACRGDVAVCKPEAFTTRCQPSKFKPHLRQMCESSRRRRSVEGHKDDFSDLRRPPSEDLPDLGLYVR